MTLWLQPTRLLCSWDFSGKNTGIDCHFPLPGDLPDPGIKAVSPISPALQANSLLTESTFSSVQFSSVSQSCSTLWDPMDCSQRYLMSKSIKFLFWKFLTFSLIKNWQIIMQEFTQHQCKQYSYSQWPGLFSSFPGTSCCFEVILPERHALFDNGEFLSCLLSDAEF